MLLVLKDLLDGSLPVGGTSGVGTDGRPNGPMYAAWLPRYGNGRIDSSAVRYADGTLPAHGDEVECWVEEEHYRSRRFSFWRVREIARAGSGLQSSGERSWRRVTGWVCITNANINRKHDERIFFFGGGTVPPGPFNVTDKHRRMWRELIQNYQSIHQDALRRRDRNR